jgi:hypothetical protein
MRVRFLLIATLAAIVCFTVSAQEQGVSDRLKSLKAAAVDEKAIPGGGPASASGAMRDMAMVANNVTQVEGQIANQDFENARRFIRQWMQNTTSPQIRKMLDDLLAEVEKLAKDRDEKLRAKAKGLLEKASAACLAAKKEEDLAPVMDEMRDFVESELNTGRWRRSSRWQQEFSNALQFMDRWQEFVAAQAAGSLDAALQALQQLSGYSSKLVPRSKLMEIQKELAPKAFAGFKEQIAKAGAQLAAAKTAAQATEAADAISTAYDDMNRFGGSMPSSLRMLFDGAQQAAREWRAILQFEEQGRPAMALQRLRNLEQNNYSDFRILPAATLVTKRAALVKKMMEGAGDAGSELTAEVDRVVAGIKSGADLATARTKVERLQRIAGSEGDPIQQSLYRLMSDLALLETAYRQAQGGGETASLGAIPWRGGYSVEGHPWQKPLAVLRETLLAEVVQVRFELPEIAKAKGTDLSAKLESLADEAFAKSDWTRLLCVLNALRFSSGIPDYVAAGASVSRAGAAGEAAAVASLLSGQNLEKAGQFSAAAESYRDVLRQTGKRVPVKAATERLLTISKDHPEVAKDTPSAR